jgi:hypothetical protein
MGELVMAGEGYRIWTPGEVITANNVQRYLMDQSVQVFEDSDARDTALTGYVSEGMASYTESDQSLAIFNGSAWVTVESFTGGTVSGQVTLGAGGNITSYGALATTSAAIRNATISTATPTGGIDGDLWLQYEA